MSGPKRAWRQGGMASVLLFSLPIAGLAVIFTILRSVDEEATPVASQPGLLALLKAAPLDSPGLGDWVFCSPVDLAAWKEQSEYLRGVTGFVANQEPWRSEGAYRMASVASAGHDLFSVLGVHAALGRVWSGMKGDGQSVVATDRFWRRSLGGRRDVVGKSLWLDGQAYTLIGVLAPSFRLRAIDSLGDRGLDTRSLDLIRPIGRVHFDHTSSMFQVLAVPKVGVSLQIVSSQLTELERRIVEEHPRSRPGTVVAMRYSDIVSSRFCCFCRGRTVACFVWLEPPEGPRSSPFAKHWAPPA